MEEHERRRVASTESGTDSLAQQANCGEKLRMGKGSDTHLEMEARDAPEHLVVVPNLLNDRIRPAHNDGASGSKQCVELTSCDRGPAAFASNLCKSSSIAGEEIIRSLLIGCSHIAEGVDADPQAL
jgi:hypothetical protein